MEPLRIFIGFDARETAAFHVLAHSIHARATRPVAVTPIVLDQLEPEFQRPRDPLQSTDFSFSRFLTPYLSGFAGWSLFMDCDMLMRADIAELFALRDERYAVMCVKHNHVPRETTKFLGETQTKYAEEELVQRHALQQRALHGADAGLCRARLGPRAASIRVAGRRRADRRPAASLEPPGRGRWL